MNDFGISIILCYYNSEDYIQRALESVINQGNIHIELILVNNNSSDNSAEIVKEFVQKRIIQDRRLNISIKMVNEQRQGLAFARNAGFNLVTKDYVYILDSDNQLVEGVMSEIAKRISNIKSDWFLLKNQTVSGRLINYSGKFNEYWTVGDLFGSKGELTPIFSKEIVMKYRYFEYLGIITEMPSFYYCILFKHGLSLYVMDIYGQIYDDKTDHQRISTATIFSKRSLAAVAMRYNVLKICGEILPLKWRLYYFLEYNVFFIFCLVLGFNISDFCLNSVYKNIWLIIQWIRRFCAN